MFLVNNANAQSIKGQLLHHQQREVSAMQSQKQVQLSKAQFDLTELFALVKCKNLDSINQTLNEKGWELSSSLNNVEQYDEKLCSKHRKISWAFEKEYDNDEADYMAIGWFHLDFLTEGDNAVVYQMKGRAHRLSLEAQLINEGYQSDIVGATNKGDESVYRNDTFEVSIFKKTDDAWYYDDDCYTFSIYNFQQVEERKLKEKQYKDAISNADSAFYEKNYALARQTYVEAVRLMPEKREELRSKMADVDILILCEEADSLVKAKNYELAKAKYNKALNISPNNYFLVINNGIKAVDEILDFLQKRTVELYDYQILENSDYKSLTSNIAKRLEDSLLLKEGNLSQTEITITCFIDTLGKTSVQFIPAADEQLNAVLTKIANDISLKQCSLYDYPVNAVARFPYVLEYNHAKISVKKTNKGLISKHTDFPFFKSDIASLLGNDAPYATYKFDLRKASINNVSSDQNKMLRMNISDGGANALLSLLVPGLGDHRVSHGQKKGIGIAISTYGLIGAGIGLKYYSNKQFENYQNATSAKNRDWYDKCARHSNYLFYACVASAGIIWFSDIIWVAVNGSKNAKEAKSFKNTKLGAYYNSASKAPAVYYSLTF